MAILRDSRMYMYTYIRVHVTCTCNVTIDKNCAVTVQTEMDTLGFHLVRKNILLKAPQVLMPQWRRQSFIAMKLQY